MKNLSIAMFLAVCIIASATMPASAAVKTTAPTAAKRTRTLLVYVTMTVVGLQLPGITCNVVNQTKGTTTPAEVHIVAEHGLSVMAAIQADAGDVIYVEALLGLLNKNSQPYTITQGDINDGKLFTHILLL
ncbi:hypothetical protein [Chitinophaga sp. Cy-1792]|uniref:hypothetical protein n=1 Tax=Chitinophaga sp. Cy-1792 TaxID=2608339 RepID=UPI0014224C3B|nr:hypothetical protein [Chitinophaga sp. Cy-1792]NIG52943.1 hypothetical protein [Chitinophaga sp. Cy-1792]